MLSAIDWKWFIIGILTGIFVIPFVQAKLGGKGGPVSKNRV
ncbi:hypothetical protein Toil_gp16 [Rhodococcus phage Toil]|jgi:hypothetical protein|uniref:Uncharacterized protein n=1 Tax=Rhodococcus phage Toil TaxID=1975614 RepID=A0A1W6DXU1_9VIRU|nr:hypothetical protein KMD62_gp16 [Rhodococcus phage Toil]ARK07699.1 hypothetical protein Toil_gp16 [Rhodococcus phage Toil]